MSPSWRRLRAIVVAALLAGSVAAQPPQSGEQLPVPGKPVPADYSKLSEHNIEWLHTQPLQVQAEFLLQAAISHQKGATDWIERLVDDWHGKLQDTPRWQVLEESALYSSDLRVRAAAIEMNLAVRNLAKSDDAALGLIESAEKHAGNRPYAAWELGMLANRGVQKERIYELLSTWIHDQNQQTRFWAVEGLAHIGSDETIKNFLDMLRNDASLDVRERAGCSLAKSGMLTREQRMHAVPGLLELADDPSLDATTRSWVYQALREITDVFLPNEPATWRNWYASHGTERMRQFHSEGSSVLGNN
jgi:HEAT repeat protein